METAAAYAEALARRLEVSVLGLRQLPGQALHQAELTLGRDPAMVRSLGRPPVLPVLDGEVLQAWPRDAALAPIPLLIGTTQTEGTFWYDLVGPDGVPVPGQAPPRDMAHLQSMIRDLVAIYRPEAVDLASAIAPAYADAARARGGAATPLALWITAYTDIVFRLRARAAAERHAAAGHPTYLYEFAHLLQAPAHGVPHTAEIPFVFGTFADPFFAGKVGTGPAEQALSDAMLQAWARFAHDGDPGPGWSRATPRAPAINVLGGPGDWLTVHGSVRGEELAAWGVV
jgi:para-nitrobenzyl esterase